MSLDADRVTFNLGDNNCFGYHVYCSLYIMKSVAGTPSRDAVPLCSIALEELRHAKLCMMQWSHLLTTSGDDLHDDCDNGIHNSIFA